MLALPAGAPSRFDFVLLWMAVALVSGFGVAFLSSLSLQVGGSLGSLLASLAMFDGLVRNPPQEE